MKVSVINLGCAKNLTDAETMLGLIKNAGYRIVNNIQEANIVVVNTCGFILDAKEESINTILELVNLKKNGDCKIIVAAGCLAQKYGSELLYEIPELDGVLGTGAIASIAEVLQRALKGERPYKVGPPGGSLNEYIDRVKCTPFYTSYVKIAEGCNNQCSYCLIPELRGAYQSRSQDSILKEVRYLAKSGVKEIVLIAQDTSYYGKDLYGRYSLPSLLSKIAKVEGVEWVRFLYTHPAHITEELMEVVAGCSKICNYLDIPLQHASSEILKKMGRPKSRQEIETLLDKIRKYVPDITLRSTFIVGFPGEKEKHFQQLLDFIKEQSFDWVGVFKYSQEEGTKSAKFSSQVPEKIKEERYHRLMLLQREITQKKNERWLGKRVKVLTEGNLEGKANFYTGRTEGQAPEVDGSVCFRAQFCEKGNFVTVRITEVNNYDLIGEKIYEPC